MIHMKSFENKVSQTKVSETFDDTPKSFANKSFANKVSETKVSQTFDDTHEKFRKQSFGNKSFANFL